jgi:adenylate cyclase
MRICSRAVEIDPYYARAWALLALAQSNLRYMFRCQVDDGFAAAHSALTIDPGIAEAHIPLIRRLEDRRAYADADAEMEKALGQDSDSWEVNKEAARVRLRQGRVDHAAQLFEKVASLMDSDVHAWARLVSCHHKLGDGAAKKSAAESTIAQAERVLAQDPSNGAAMSFGALAHAALGQTERAREWMERGLLIDPDNAPMRYNLACTLAAYLGDKEGALKLLERNLPTVSAFHISMAEAEPDFDPLRDDPRFDALMNRARKRLGIELPATNAKAAAGR